MSFPAAYYTALAAQGRNGDTELAHVTPAEKDLLQELGGSGTLNPTTGLREFFDVADAAGVGMPGMGNGSMGSGGGMAGPGMGDPRGEDAAGPGGSVGAPTSPSGAAAPNTSGMGWKDAATLAGAVMSPAAAASPMGPAVGMLSAIASGKSPEQLSSEEIAAMVPGGSIGVALGHGLGALAGMLGLQNQGVGISTASGAPDVASYGTQLPESSTIASTAATAAPAPAAAKSILPQSPISGLDAQTYDYLKRMGILA